MRAAELRISRTRQCPGLPDRAERLIWWPFYSCRARVVCDRVCCVEVAAVRRQRLGTGVADDRV